MRASMALAGTLFVVYLGATALAEISLRETDFRNYEYPWAHLGYWPDEMRWMDGKQTRAVRVRNGVWPRSEIEHAAAEPGEPFAGLTLDSVVYGDLLGDEREEAVVILRYDTGGTMYYYFVYVFSFMSGRPEVVAWFHSGDRAAHGLHEVRVEPGMLIVELYDPAHQRGDCCSSGIERRRYRWSKRAFRQTGKSEFAGTRRTSRRRVTLFGTPVE